jgi:nicotinic acid mononucleotide adenylyltransferase
MIEKNPQRKEKVTDYTHRKKIVELSLGDFESIECFDPNVDNITFENTETSLKQKFPGATFVMIIGSDMLEHLPDWPGFADWIKGNELAVVLRDNKDKKSVEAQLKKLDVSAKILPAVWSPVSSSTVKHEIKKAKFTDLVHRQAMHYITEHKLYR